MILFGAKEQKIWRDGSLVATKAAKSTLGASVGNCVESHLSSSNVQVPAISELENLFSKLNTLPEMVG